MAMSPSMVPRFGIMPVGQVIPLMVLVSMDDGVAALGLKSKVSHGLGAPAINTKITFFAVFNGVTLCDEHVPVCPLASFAKYDPATPAPISWKKFLRVQSGRRNIPGRHA